MEDAESSGVSENEASEDYDGEEWHGVGESVEYSDPESNDEANTPPQTTTSSYFQHGIWH